MNSDGIAIQSDGIAMEEVLFRRLPDAVTSLGWSRLGELAILLADGSVLLAQGDVILGASEISDAIALSWEPSGEHLAVVDHDGEIALWSRGRGWRPFASLPGFGTRLTWSPNGRLAASAGTRVLIYDFARGKVGEPPTVLAELPAIITDVAWRGPDHLCVATLLGTWALDCRDGDRAMASEEGVASLSLSVAANGTLAIGQAGGQLIVRWSATEGCQLDGYATPLWRVAWSEEAGMCITTTDGLVVAWQALRPEATADRPSLLDAHRCEVVSLATCAGSALVVSADVAGKVFAWDPRPEHAALGRWQSSTTIHCCAWADEGRRLAVGTDAGLWLLEVSRSDPGPSNGSASDGTERFDHRK